MITKGYHPKGHGPKLILYNIFEAKTKLMILVILAKVMCELDSGLLYIVGKLRKKLYAGLLFI